MLNIDWATIAFQAINFLVLAAALYRWGFRPVMARVQERRAKRERMMAETEEDRRQAKEVRRRLEARLSDAEEEADEIIAEAKRQAEAQHQRMMEEVEQRVEETLSDAQQDVQQMREQALDEFHDELIAAILDIGGELIRQAAPSEMHDAMVARLNDRIWEMGREEMERVRAFRRSLGDRTPTAHVTTANPLTSEQQGELARTLTALADRAIDIEMTTDPDLAAGIQVRLGDIVVDNSMAGRLEDLREQTSEALKAQLSDDQTE